MGKLDGLHPTVRKATEELLAICEQKGIEMIITHGLRTIDEQNALYAKGRTAPGPIVTKAKGGTSYHNYGLAIDYCLVKDGKAVWVVNEDWRAVASEAKKLGFEWGGDWKSFRDYPHLQMTFGLSISQLKAGKRPANSAPAPVTPKPISKPVPKPTPTPVPAIKAKAKPAVKAKATKYIIPTIVLRQGSKGTAVKQLQTALNAAKFRCDVDGSYGPGTEDAVSRFQSVHCNPADGIFGPATRAALNKLVN